MTKYIVNGGKPLFGEVEISGAKNAAVAIIPAAILVDGVCRIENIPQISDVTAILKILEQLGRFHPLHQPPYGGDRQPPYPYYPYLL